MGDKYLNIWITKLMGFRPVFKIKLMYKCITKHTGAEGQRDCLFGDDAFLQTVAHSSFQLFMEVLKSHTFFDLTDME